MEFLKKLIESTVAKPVTEMAQDQWHDVDGISKKVGNFLIAADGYYDENELYVNVFNTDTKEAFRAEVHYNGKGFDISVTDKHKRTPLKDEELEAFVTQLVLGFVQENYSRIVSPDRSDYDPSDDDYYTRRDKMRQGREYRSEIESDY